MKNRVRNPKSAIALCVLLISFGLAETFARAAEEGHGGGSTGDGCVAREKQNKHGATNMVFDHGACSSWEPNVASADAESQDIALRTFQSLMDFCIKHPTLGDLKSAGYKAVGDKSHWVKGGVSNKPGTSTESFIKFAGNPDHAIIDKEGAGNDSTRNTGLMAIEGYGLAHIGSLMRPHGSHGTAGDDPSTEMLHLWCMPTIEQAMHSNNPGSDKVPDVQVLQAALDASKTGGIAAVSKAGGAAAAPAAGAGVAGAAGTAAATGAVGTHAGHGTTGTAATTGAAGTAGVNAGTAPASGTANTAGTTRPAPAQQQTAPAQPAQPQMATGAGVKSFAPAAGGAPWGQRAF